VRATADGEGEPGAFALRFPGYRGPADLLAVLVREGDLGAAAVPVAPLADAVGAWPPGGPQAVVEQVRALGALTDVWRVRMRRVQGEVRLAGVVDEGPDGPPVRVDASLSLAVAGLSALEEAARARLSRTPSPPPSRRAGSARDVWVAYARALARVRPAASAAGLWPEAPALPIMRQMRRMLAGLRRRARLRLVADSASAPEAVAAVLAALELVRRGRLRVWQRAAYAPVVVARPRALAEREEPA